ncbi:sulfatase-modifying factor protein [Phormidesmis priestleyi ULC007]|uniref:Sulfatase-modifying factor protein n=1 Tax=Phormidesmis priestleyi ULC007 TaxID=1920490 RepID=A0A2T1DNK0_9CYAN|nr:SUMF1/EgtB/PvdO family nonheme iron enzyme [Phormidesmis priestleyi]PSB22042.1 sulfatase-modifying factor protein [Phormidesmis priestleyi ULC007]PZO54990.1 MAG: sulfatase-modifying factor protein [Phormidesmis priestleyi]
MAKVALLIGVSEYEPGLNPLPAAANDVEAMRRVLQHPEIGGFDRVTPLQNPDLLTMQNEISTLFDNCHEDDLLLLYFSGHGITDEFGKFYFTNCSTRKNSQGKLNKGTAVPASFVHDVMENCTSNRQVVILDCCNSGAFGEGMIARDAEGAIDFKQQLGGEGRIVLTSSSAVEYSFERKGEELAVYTRYLVEGIETGAADLDRDGKVSVNELHDCAKARVSKAAPSMRPQRYILQEGEKIFLANAPISDPKLLYRSTVEEFSQDGIIRPAGRRVLNRRSQSLNLTIAEAAAIEAEVLEPYLQHQRNLQEYEEVLQEEIAIESPLSDRTRQELKALQKDLNLTDENVGAIEQRVLKSRPAPPPVEPSIPRPAPPTPRTVSTFEFDIVTLEVQQKSGLFGQKKLTTQTRPGRAEYFTEDFLKLDMVSIPGGSFTMGSMEYDGEKPPHKVTIAPFFMSKYPITQAQWSVIASLPKINLDLDPDPSNFKGANRPVEQVSWDEVVEFCDRISQKTEKTYRLPSEAEWEYACRAGTTTPFHFGETITTDLVNYDGNETYGDSPKGVYRKQTTDVGSFPPNAFGLYDTHGNVWEWCADPWHENYDNAPADGRVWELDSDRENTLRLLRGGSWSNNPIFCRSAYRNRTRRDDRNNNIGFRVLLPAPRTP